MTTAADRSVAGTTSGTGGHGGHHGGDQGGPAEERTGERRRPPPVLLGAIALAWVAGIAAQLTGQAHAVHHDLHGGHLPLWGALGVFLVAWQAHVVAMMLPSSLPLVHLFTRAAAHQPRPRVARAAFLAGYAAVWTGFGILGLAADAGIRTVATRWSWLDDRPHVIAGVALVVAGAFQFSDLKDRCLRECRHPALFLQRHYRRGAAGAFALGQRHGRFCLGCCWALMVIMFAVGISNMAWMAPLTLLLLYEKVGRHGERVVAPAGAVLLVAGGLVLVSPDWLSPLVPA